MGYQCDTIYFSFRFWGLGIHPKDKSTLIGILYFRLYTEIGSIYYPIHLPLFIFGVVLFLIYPSIALQIWILNYIITGFLVWCFVMYPNPYHIGASGIIYGLGAFYCVVGF